MDHNPSLLLDFLQKKHGKTDFIEDNLVFIGVVPLVEEAGMRYLSILRPPSSFL